MERNYFFTKMNVTMAFFAFITFAFTSSAFFNALKNNEGLSSEMKMNPPGILVEESSLSSPESNEMVDPPLLNPPSNCECNGYIYEFTVEYNGPAGIGGGAYDDHDNEFGYWNNLQPGQQYTFNVSNSNHPGEYHDHNNPEMWTYVNGQWISHGVIHSSCSEDILGNSYGPWTVVSYTDIQGNVCEEFVDNCPPGFNLSASATVSNNTGCGSLCDVLCFESTTGNNDVSAQMAIDVIQGQNTITLRTIYAKTFCDNTYGSNKIGWPGNHTFDNLRGSDKLELSLYDANGNLSLQFELDYIDDGNQGPSGYGTGGVLDGDGDMIVGNANHILDVKTSLSENFNTYGYVLTTNSPATDANYTPNPQYPNWIFDVWYEVTVDLAAFGNAGWGYPEITDFHASPSKTGNNSEPVEFSECCGNNCSGTINLTMNNGVAPYTYLWSNGATTQDLGNLCEGTYTVQVTDALGCQLEQSYTVGQDQPVIAVDADINFNSECDQVPTPGPCTCNGYIYEFTVEYNGTAGIGGGAYDDHDNEYGYWNNLQPGQQYTFNVSNSNHPGEYHNHNNPEMWTYVNGQWISHGVIHSSCSQNVVGNTYGPWTVVSYTDIHGNVCPGSVTTCDGSITVTPVSGATPFTYSWSNGATGNNITGLCEGDYSVVVTDANGCSEEFQYVMQCGPQVPPTLVETCIITGYESATGRVFWIPNFGTDFRPSSQGLFLDKYDNGTAHLRGQIERISNSSHKFSVSLWFDNESNYSEWTAQGLSAHSPQLGNESTWTFYSFDQSEVSTLTGQGSLLGQTLYLEDTGSGYGLQIGNGANALNSNSNGISTWFNYSGTASGNGDINGTFNCNTNDCEVGCPADVTLECDANVSPEFTGYPQLVCDGNVTCARGVGEFDLLNEPFDGVLSDWSFGPGWNTGTGCAPGNCGSFPNAFIDYSNFYSAYNTKLTSLLLDACCTDQVELSFCMRQDLYGSSNVPGYLAIQYRILGGTWQTVHTYTSQYGQTIDYSDSFSLPVSGEQFEIRFSAYGNGSSGYTMGGWGIDNVVVSAHSPGCEPSPIDVTIDWSFTDQSSGTCPEVITRTFTGEYNGEALSCTQSITLVDEVAPVFTYVPADATVSCSENLPNEDATAIDNCGDAIITVADASSSNGCDDLITRTFTATDNCGNTATAVQLINVIADVPTVSASSTPDNCTQVEGSITLTFEDSACRSAIKLSIDGGANFIQVNDNSGAYTFEGLTGGTYNLFAQWGDNDCPTDLEDITVGDNTEIELEINNYGICVVDLYEWLPGGDQFVEELAPGETFFVTTHVGAMWRIVGDNWNPGDFDAQYTVEGCFDQVWNVNPDYCQPECVGDLSVDAGPDQSICEGESVTLTANISGETDCNEIISCYTIGNGTAPAGCFPTPGTGVIFRRAQCGGPAHEIWQAGNDLRLTEFADGTATIEGTLTNNGQVGVLHMDLYEKENTGNTWNASCYTNNLGSNRTFYRSFIGSITVGNEVFTIEEKLSEQHFILADGAGFNTGSYGLGSWTGGTFGGCTEWFATLTPCDIPSQETTIVWSTGETTESITVNAGGTYSVTVTDCAGCVAQDEVTINILESPEVSVSSTNPVCLEENGSITFTFADVASRTNIEFSIDGGNTWPAEYNVADNSASFTIDGLAPGTYELVTRWGNDECPVDLGNISLVADECASLGNFVFYDNDRDGIQDAGEEGVEGVEVELYICGEDTPVASTSTNANGIYVFENLNPANDYYVVFVGSSLPADYVFSTPNQGGDDTTDSDADENGQTACVELESGEFNDTVDAGINQPTASLGNFVFYDDDRDGIQDAGEEGVENVTVQLFVNGGAAPVATTTTNENGFYIFENLDPGVEYFVVFAPASLPADYVFSPANQGGDDALDSDAGVNGQSPIVVLAPGEFNDTIDAGINNPLGSIGDFVWEDEDQDGIQDPNEDGIQGVNVELYICGETDPIASTSTDENGFYNFPNLEPGVEYFVVFETPTGFTGTTANAGASDTNDSDADENGATACYELSPGEDYEDFDAGFFIPTNIGDFVWYDDNQNGIQDAGEEGVNGVEVNLVAAGTDGIFGTADDQVIASDTTDENGMYLFENVLPGEYIIVFNPETLPVDYVLTAQNQGGDDELDSDADSITGATEPFTVVYGQDDDLSFDAGISTCPVPTLNEEEPVDVSITCEDNVPAAAELTFSDFIYGDAEVVFTEEMNELDCGEEIVRTWTATNECGSTATVDQVITITDDLAPVITFQTPDQTIECDQEIPEIVVTYEDNCDENLTVVVDNWINDLDCGFEYVKYCSATDDCGNMSEATVTITVLDTTPPVATNQPEDITIECDEEVPAFDPMFEDNCDETLELSAQSNQSAGDCGFQISRSWTAIDDCGNETSVSQIITIVDTTAPVFLTTPADYVVNCDNGSSDPEFAGEPTVEDNCDNNPVLTFVDGVAGQDCPASFERTWTVRDNCGNEEVYVQVITINDFAAPVLVTPADVTIECDESTDPSNTGMATATDDCSMPNVTYVDGPLSGDCPYTFERTWTAIDACGNSEEGVQVITIEDTEAPVADGEGQEITIECDEEMPQLTMTFHDNCDTNLEVTVTTSVEMEGCNEIFYQTITATDECGNQSAVTNVITVVDTTAPVLIGVPEDATIDCNDEVPAAIVSAMDNCDENPLVSMSASTEFLACGYEIIRTWTAVDECGNESSDSQVLTVIDTEAPVVTAPADYVVNCDNGSSDPEFAGEATATDNCSEFTITFTDGPATDVCPATFERTWTATDACGNAASDVQIITINDFAAPVITCPA
ncbi:MAG: SdrD B-like domain-containing protein, partial [Flavobacteriales bacterium]|nr:SdrD B-like domain-containing protein [Flavobacteriales bacterium]